MRKKKYVIPLIIVMAVSLAYILYAQSVCNADETATYAYLYSYFELGQIKLSIKEYLNPWFFCSAIGYLLNIGGSGSTISIAYLVFWYGIACFFTFLLISYEIDNKWLFSLAFFILLPYELTNKYHMTAAFVTLFLIWGAQYYRDSKKKWVVAVSIFVTIYSLIFTNDKVILILFVFSTIAIYYGISFLQDKKKHKYLYLAALVIAIGAMLLKVFDIINVELLGAEHRITEEWGGYGGSDYLTWIDIYTFFDKGIPSFFSSLLIQWNVPLEGGMIQFNSFYWIIRMGIALLAIIALISKWVEIVKKGIKNVTLLDSLSVICVTVVSIINILNGMIWYYDIEQSPMNRYASVCWFLLVVILIRWINERYSNRTLFHRVSTNTLLGIIFICLSIGYMGPICEGNAEIINSYCKNELEFLEKQGDTYRYGLASGWKSSPITAATNGKRVVCPGWIEEGRLIGKDSYGFYSDGSNYFNFIISDTENEMTVSPENIEEIRGDYIDIYSNTSTMYLYDYDIRWEPKVVMECVGTDYELLEPIEYQFDFPVGTNRIEMTVANSQNFDLSIADNPDIQEETIQKLDDKKIYVDLVCLQNTNVTFKVARITDELTTIHKIVLKRVKGAVTVYPNEQNSMEAGVYLNQGSYIFTFAGQNIEALNVDWIGEGIKVEQVTDGRLRRRYKVQVNTPQTVNYTISGENLIIDKIAYENEHLFSVQ